MPADGMVRIQATRMRRATPQRTRAGALARADAHDRAGDDLGGRDRHPEWAVVSRIEAAVVSAAKPWTGSSLATRWPIVFMIRQPPTAVPADSAVADTMMTHVGTMTVGMTPAEKRARVMMPIVFCASFDPWAKAMNAAEKTWRRRKRSDIGLRFERAEDPVDRQDEREGDHEAQDAAT